MRLSKNEAKYLRSLQQKKVRARDRKFVLEGWRAVGEAVKSSAAIEYVAVMAGSATLEQTALLRALQERCVPVREMDAATLKIAAATVHAQGVLALVAQKTFSVEAVLTGTELVVAVDGVTDPGNLGTLLRTCDWFGVGGVLLGQGSVELYNEKVVRSTAGSLLHLPVAEAVDLAAALAGARRQGFTVLTASGDGAVDYTSTACGVKNVFVFGSEAHGVSAAVRKVSDAVLRIPRFGRVESLNVGVACGILLAHLRSRSL